jgi:hypothetical protein
MYKHIREWYTNILTRFCAGELEGYNNARDLLIEQMIQSFKLSVSELLVCNGMSVKSLITKHKEYKAKLNDFKKTIAQRNLVNKMNNYRAMLEDAELKDFAM